MNKNNRGKIFIVPLAIFLGVTTTGVFAQTSTSVLYVPLIGITSVPEPSALPDGAGNVVYHYAVKTFLQDLPLADVHVTDSMCSPVAFVEGDDNGNSKLDYSETWRYSCMKKLSTTTESTATATGVANSITATHTAYATVVVGSSVSAPLVSIVNITKVAYPLSLPPEGGPITFTYRVNNPGIVPLGAVTVVDDKCSAMSGKLGDTNGNNLLDTNEVWVYTCTTVLRQTTTNKVTVTAVAHGLKAVSSDTITVKVKSPTLPEAGALSDSEPTTHQDMKITIWVLQIAILLGLIVLKSRVESQKK